MAPSFDCAVSSLLCGEDNDSIFDDNDVGAGAVVEDTWHHHGAGFRRGPHVGGGGEEVAVPLMGEESVAAMVGKERQHQPNVDYLKRLRSGGLDFGARQEAVDWIGKVNAHFGFGPLCAYLSINYLDRFLSAYELPKGQAWTMQLLSVACLSLAAKMEETDVPLSLDLQVVESKFVFEARTIQRMELLVLSTLHWRMQAVTPFSFIDHFLAKVNNDDTPSKPLILQSIQIILGTIKGIDFLEFRPSEVAAAVAIAVVGETKTVDTEQAISLLTQHVEKERVIKCIKLIQDLAFVGGSGRGTSGSVISVPQSPIGVLDAACLSYRSDDLAVGSCVNSPQQGTTTPSKRRRLK